MWGAPTIFKVAVPRFSGLLRDTSLVPSLAHEATWTTATQPRHKTMSVILALPPCNRSSPQAGEIGLQCTLDLDLVHDQFPPGVIRHESEGEGVQDWRSGWASRAMRSGSGPACGRPQLPIMSTVRSWRRRLALDRYLNQLRLHATCRPSHLHRASGTIFPPALCAGMGPVDPQPRHATIG
jgi:hypothetical protein